jgi:hypothetical protein
MTDTTKPVALKNLLAAAEQVIAGLHARIDAADKRSVPVFDGIADLHDAIHEARSALSEAPAPEGDTDGTAEIFEAMWKNQRDELLAVVAQLEAELASRTPSPENHVGLLSPARIDEAARHLRETLQSGKALRPWTITDKATKKKWVALAEGTFRAALATTEGSDNG